MIFPGVFLSLTVLSINLVGDGLRDALDPKLRRRASRPPADAALAWWAPGNAAGQWSGEDTPRCIKAAGRPFVRIGRSPLAA